MKGTQKTQEAAAASKKSGASGKTVPIIAVAVIVVIVIIAGVAVLMPHQAAKTATTASTTAFQSQLPVQVAPSTPGMTSQQILSMLGPEPQQKSFTATYAGTANTSYSTESLNYVSYYHILYERYNDSALIRTAVSIATPNKTINATQYQYYASNGTDYTCTSNATTNQYACASTPSVINASDFAIPFVIGVNSTSLIRMTASNSTYDGTKCLLVNSGFNTTSPSSSGVTSTARESLSSCIDPRYRVPLFLNVTVLETASGNYRNGTSSVSTPINEQGAQVVRFHIVNVTNVSSASQVSALPPNAIMVS